MSKVFAVMYDLKSNSYDYSCLFNQLTSSKGWSHYIESAWLIETDETIELIWKRIEPTIDKRDFILIIEIRKNYQGWLPKEAWNWINERVSF